MNALAVLYVNDHLERMMEDAQRQSTKPVGPSLLERIASAASALRSALTGPKLDDLPARS